MDTACSIHGKANITTRLWNNVTIHKTQTPDIEVYPVCVRMLSTLKKHEIVGQWGPPGGISAGRGASPMLRGLCGDVTDPGPGRPTACINRPAFGTSRCQETQALRKKSIPLFLTGNSRKKTSGFFERLHPACRGSWYRDLTPRCLWHSRM
jgi:hypothetical protein